MNSCETTVLAAAALAVQIARTLTQEETAALGLFFTSLGDNLSLLSNECRNKNPALP